MSYDNELIKAMKPFFTAALNVFRDLIPLVSKCPTAIATFFKR